MSKEGCDRRQKTFEVALQRVAKDVNNGAAGDMINSMAHVVTGVVLLKLQGVPLEHILGMVTDAYESSTLTFIPVSQGGDA